jgi:CAP12/Pycsar effector protein, TIR domain
MDTLATKLQELIQQGEKLVPEGGEEFSGYNAKMQSQYLMWRKHCLDYISKLGEKGSALRTKITGDENGPYFYQSSAQTVLDATKEAFQIAEADPSIGQKPAEPEPKPKKTEPPAKDKTEIKPEVKVAKIATQPEKGNRVFVVSTPTNQLFQQMTVLLKEIGIEAIPYHRTPGSSDGIIPHVEKYADARYAFVLFSPDDALNLMYEIGYLVGKLGAERVCCIHQKDVPVPKSLPGVHVKEVVVKLEEISLSLFKELKAVGYSITI